MTSSRYFCTLLIALLALGLAACEAIYKDVSENKEHRKLIGKDCQLLASLRAHGVGEKYGPNKGTDYVSVWNPGFSGPEVTFTSSLPAGTKFQVVAAKQCSNCPFDKRLHYQIEMVTEPPEFIGIPVLVRSESFTGSEVRCESSSGAV